MGRPEVIILAPDAEELAGALAKLPAGGIRVAVARSAEAALALRAEPPILFGDPNLIAAVLPRMPAVRWVQSSWAGVAPLLALPRRDYVLTGIKDVFGEQMAEYVIGYLLAHELRMERRLEAQRARRWLGELSGTLERKTLGIMGTGSIGRKIAGAARGFALRVRGLSRSGAPAQGFDEVFPAEHLHAFLAGLDYLVAVLPDTPATGRMLDAEALRRLPRHCYLVNVGRGNLLDELALAAALARGELAGAALDVFEREPLPAQSPLWTAPNIRITGHVASPGNPDRIAPIFAENYRRFERGEPLAYVVDFERGY